MNYEYSDDNRIGDHVWWISDVSKFKSHYPQWDYRYSLTDIMQQIHRNMSTR
jgi:CDP-paratose 2-epimerase